MKCLKYENISAYLDNELGDKERSSAELHLKTCPRCAGALEEMQSTRSAFTNSARHDAPYGFSTRLLARTAKLDRKKSWRFMPLLATFAEAAVLLTLITVGIITGKAMTNSSSVPQATNITSSFSLDLFEPTPPGSLGEAYLATMEALNEK